MCLNMLEFCLPFCVHAVASGMFQSSTFGFAGILPQKYTAAVMSGQVSLGYC